MNRATVRGNASMTAACASEQVIDVIVASDERQSVTRFYNEASLTRLLSFLSVKSRHARQIVDNVLSKAAQLDLSALRSDTLALVQPQSNVHCPRQQLSPPPSPGAVSSVADKRATAVAVPDVKSSVHSSRRVHVTWCAP